MSVFIANLRSLSEHCNFGDSLEAMLRDRLVCGINDGSIQKRLLAESKLTYQKAVELAQGLEAADKNAKLLYTGGEGRGCSSNTGQKPEFEVVFQMWKCRPPCKPLYV